MVEEIQDVILEEIHELGSADMLSTAPVTPEEERAIERRARLTKIMRDEFDDADIKEMNEAFYKARGKTWNGVWKLQVRNYSPNGADTLIVIEPSKTLMEKEHNGYELIFEDCIEYLKRIIQAQHYRGNTVFVKDYKGEWEHTTQY